MPAELHVYDIKTVQPGRLERNLFQGESLIRRYRERVCVGQGADALQREGRNGHRKFIVPFLTRFTILSNLFIFVCPFDCFVCF